MKLKQEQLKEIYKTINQYSDEKLLRAQEIKQQEERKKLIAFLKENNSSKHWYLILICYITLK